MEPRKGTRTRLGAFVARIRRLKAVRVLQQYNERRGPLLAAGLSYHSIFAVFAAIWVGFAIAGIVIQANPELRDALLDLISRSVPGLIGDGNGAVNRDRLLEAGILGWTGAIAAVGLLFTALGWLASGRDAVRTMFGLPSTATHFLLQKLRDLGLALGFGAIMLLSAALSVFSTAALGAALDFLGVDEESVAATVFARVVGLLSVLLLDTLVLAVFYRLVAGIRLPLRHLATGSLFGAVALGLLKTLGGSLLGGASNPLLASFAVIIGLLIWFNLIGQVFLITAAWIAVSVADDGAGPGASRSGVAVR